MTIEEKIIKINEPDISDELKSIGALPTGTADTIENFFKSFVEKRLPAPDVIKQWHKCLMEYTDESNWEKLSCCVRFGNNGSKKVSAWGEAGYYKLRRGWLTQSDIAGDSFEYFFADNAFPAFVYKMALDGFAPADADELREAFRKHKFPYGFGFLIDNKVNEHKGVVIAKGANPGFLGNYKLSHIFDAGEHFDIGGVDCGDAKLSDKYYPIGHSMDFLNEPDHIRKMCIDDFAKKVIVAKFLRFAHPFNYFLTPTKKHHICGQYVYKKDIGEDPRMIAYIKAYLKSTYPKEYGEFVERIMWYESSDTAVATGTELIDITYGLSINSKGIKKTSSSTLGKSVDNLFAEFETYAGKNGVKDPSGYSAGIRRVMRVLNLKSLDDLERCIDVAVDYCTKKIDNTSDEGEKKKYSNFRSMLKKYKLYLEDKQNNVDSGEVFLDKLEVFMRKESKLSKSSIKIYLRRIANLLKNGYSVGDIRGGIDRIIQDYSNGGVMYDPKDHGNTKSALEQVSKMIKTPYICCDFGWSSFTQMNERVTNYCVEGNVIKVFKSIGFVNIGFFVKKINDDDMEELISILEEARKNRLFADSDTVVPNVHGVISSYEYGYREMSGSKCGSLFNDKPGADALQTRYRNLIDRIIK